MFPISARMACTASSTSMPVRRILWPQWMASLKHMSCLYSLFPSSVAGQKYLTALAVVRVPLRKVPDLIPPENELSGSSEPGKAGVPNYDAAKLYRYETPCSPGESRDRREFCRSYAVMGSTAAVLFFSEAGGFRTLRMPPDPAGCTEATAGQVLTKRATIFSTL